MIIYIIIYLILSFFILFSLLRVFYNSSFFRHLYSFPLFLYNIQLLIILITRSHYNVLNFFIRLNFYMISFSLFNNYIYSHFFSRLIYFFIYRRFIFLNITWHSRWEINFNFNFSFKSLYLFLYFNFLYLSYYQFIIIFI